MTYKIIDIEGIGNVNVKKFVEAGINTMDDLLQKAENPAGRKILEETTGISGKSILKWINYVDSMCINGIGLQFSELLEIVGVDTAKGLKYRVAENLQQKPGEINNRRNLVSHVPSVPKVQKMIDQAKESPAAAEY